MAMTLSGDGRSGLAPGGFNPFDDVAMLKAEHANAVAGAERAQGLLAPLQGNGGVGVTQIASARRDAIGTTGAAPGLARSAGSDTDDATATTGDGERRVGSAAIWSGGAILVGTRDRTSGRDKLTVTSGGLSAGIDLKLADGLIVGAGGGYGADTTKIGGDDARVHGDAWSVVGYGSWSPAGPIFIDGVFGGGRLNFDTRRAVTGGMALGSRDGDMLFGSLSAGIDRSGRTVDYSAYGRVDWLHANLDPYTEAGAGIYSLTFAKRDLTSLASVLGMRISLPLAGWTPRLRGEWRHEFRDSSDQLLDYADVAGLRYRVRGDDWLRDVFTAEVGADVPLGLGWVIGADIGGGLGSNATYGTGKVSVRKTF